MGETRVDLQHLLEDLRDAYTGSLEETILTEVVANALDSGATCVRLTTSPADAALTIVDDGHGMQRRALARYHDVASSTKSRGDGIGFAGVGIKLGLLVSRDVVTETRRASTHVATRWHLASRHRAPWKWIPPPGLVANRGTAVRLTLQNQLSPLLDAAYLEEMIRRHFEPLLDSSFDELVRRHYPGGVRFEVDGRELADTQGRTEDRAPVSIRLGRRRLPSAIGFVARHRGTLAEDRQGIAISTYGKVIKRGWDWLGLAPAARAQITGLVEAPDLAACLTLSKSDFIRTGPRGASYLAFRKAIQEVVSRQLAIWGDPREGDERPRVAKLDRDLERVLEDLADDFPLLRSLVDRRAGGQKRLPMPGRGDDRVPGPLFANVSIAQDSAESLEAAQRVPSAETERGGESDGDGALGGVPSGDGDTESGPPPEQEEPPSPNAEPPASEPRSGAPGAAHVLPDGRSTAGGAAAVGTLETVPGRRRPARYGLIVQFESRPDSLEPGRLVDSTIWINDAHPAYVRAAASRSTGYHTALAVALSLAPLAVEPQEEHGFITQFLAHWGGMQERIGRRQRRGGRARTAKHVSTSARSTSHIAHRTSHIARVRAADCR